MTGEQTHEKIKSEWALKKDHLWIVITAAAAISAAYFAFNQGRISKDTENRQLRAYVGITPFSDKQEDVGRILLKNFGLTPASNVKIFGESRAISGPFLGKQLDKAVNELSNLVGLSQVVFPSDNIAWEFGPDSAISSKKTNWDTMPDAAFYTYGRIDYEDVFGTPHHTQFCVFSNHNQTRVNHCPNGNSAD